MLLALLESLGNDFLHENRARPRRCCDVSDTSSCEEDDEDEEAADEPSEHDFESSDSLSEHDVDSILASWASFAASISRSRARSSAVNAHLSALGLIGVVERAGVTHADGWVGLGARTIATLGPPSTAFEETAVDVQNCALDGIVIGGGTL